MARLYYVLVDFIVILVRITFTILQTFKIQPQYMTQIPKIGNVYKNINRKNKNKLNNFENVTNGLLNYCNLLT